MTTEVLLLGYVVALLGLVAGLALWSENRQRRFDPAASNDHIFRCTKCGSVYTDDPDVDRSRCAQCGTLNEVIRF